MLQPQKKKASTYKKDVFIYLFVCLFIYFIVYLFTFLFIFYSIVYLFVYLLTSAIIILTLVHCRFSHSRARLLSPSGYLSLFLCLSLPLYIHACARGVCSYWSGG